ncbi:MAG: Chromosome partition protein smc [uncultured Rubrobacteraceae bacterium]|uniref:Chromosome partition protein smc n=1 Tax=uncultured Rubrobacteraceae bacterium TaxID=349277 RepID=A0A6J4QRH5_9ACTN|nr:MAG: Chromosome partition protein smc [uncultured Rubrobacteraceae bacterium]
MVLSAVYIKGFKTFARPVRMPLTGGITAIVGPNGSGKSNITDAILFALGEGSPSLLRAGLMNDLIFSGADSLPPAGAAEVTLVMDNASGAISLPYEEVSLTRRISRGGETEYRINGARARLTDVRAVSGEAGLGRHSILRQGAVDAIVSGGAAACRNALEEAAGLGVFRRRRLAAARKLERAADRLESSSRLEAELSGQLRRIEVEAVAAREYREIEARYRQLSLAHLHRIVTRDLQQMRGRLAEIEEKVLALRARQESLDEERRRFAAEEKDLAGRLRLAEETIQGIENGSETLRIEALRAERVSLRLEGARDRGVDRSRLISRLQNELDEADSKVREMEGLIGGLKEEHSRRKEALASLEEHAAGLRARHAKVSQQRARLSADLGALRERRERLQGRLDAPDGLGDLELQRLGEMEEEVGSYSPEGLRIRGEALLGRLKKLRAAASERAAEANRRRGVLAALVGRTEAEIQALRTPEQAGETGGKRLHEILRPHPGYEAAVEAALGDLARGVLVQSLDEGLKFLSANETSGPAERIVVRLDAEKVSRNGSRPGKPLLECVEVLDTSFADALQRLLGGAYVLEGADDTTPNGVPKSGYDVAVTSDGLRFTRTSASRRAPDGDFARQTRLAEEERRLGTLKNRLGEELYDLRETASLASGQLGERNAEAEALASLASRTARAARLLASETVRRTRRTQATRERRATYETDLGAIEAQIQSAGERLHEVGEAERHTKEELDAAVSAVEPKYAEARETAGRLARTRTDLHGLRDHRARISRGISGLKNARTADETARRTLLARRAVEHARRLDDAARERLARLRLYRSEIARLQAESSRKRAGLAGEIGDVAGDLARSTSEATALAGELSRAEEAARAAEAEISEEWGATLEIARAATEALPETAKSDSERERARLARKLKTFGDVNLLAISQEGTLRERYEFVSVQRADAEEAATEIERIIQGVDGEIEARFEATFREVRRAFSEMVPRMLDGAAGELEVSEEGVEIGLRLKRRGWRPLRVLSGGERSLLALSFLFSIFLGRFGVQAGAAPGAFCMLDEAEAALDDLNLARFLAVVDSYRAHGQFLLVTHQKRTMAAADVLYGVSPDASGASVVVSKRLTGD